jgi:hypothetical protein
MKIFLSIIFLSFASLTTMAQSEDVKKTQEQRIAEESNRKSKGGKKKLSLRKKINISNKQDKKARRTEPPKPKPRKRKRE